MSVNNSGDQLKPPVSVVTKSVDNKPTLESKPNTIKKTILDIGEKINHIFTHRDSVNPVETLQQLASLETPKPIIPNTNVQDQAEITKLTQTIQEESTPEVPKPPHTETLFPDRPSLYELHHQKYIDERKTIRGILNRIRGIYSLKKNGIKDAEKIYDGLRSRGIKHDKILTDDKTKHSRVGWYRGKEYYPVDDSNILKAIDRLYSIGSFEIEDFDNDTKFENFRYKSTQVLSLSDDQFQQRYDEVKPYFFIKNIINPISLFDKNFPSDSLEFQKYLYHDFFSNPKNQSQCDPITNNLEYIIDQNSERRQVNMVLILDQVIRSEINQDKPVYIPAEIISLFKEPSHINFFNIINLLKNRQIQKYASVRYLNNRTRDQFDEQGYAKPEFYEKYYFSHELVLTRNPKIFIPESNLSIFVPETQKFWRQVSALPTVSQQEFYYNNLCSGHTFNNNNTQNYFNNDTNIPQSEFYLAYYHNLLKTVKNDCVRLPENFDIFSDSDKKFWLKIIQSSHENQLKLFDFEYNINLGLFNPNEVDILLKNKNEIKQYFDDNGNPTIKFYFNKFINLDINPDIINLFPESEKKLVNFYKEIGNKSLGKFQFDSAWSFFSEFITSNLDTNHENICNLKQEIFESFYLKLSENIKNGSLIISDDDLFRLMKFKPSVEILSRFSEKYKKVWEKIDSLGTDAPNNILKIFLLAHPDQYESNFDNDNNPNQKLLLDTITYFYDLPQKNKNISTGCLKSLNSLIEISQKLFPNSEVFKSLFLLQGDKNNNLALFYLKNLDKHESYFHFGGYQDKFLIPSLNFYKDFLAFNFSEQNLKFSEKFQIPFRLKYFSYKNLFGSEEGLFWKNFCKFNVNAQSKIFSKFMTNKSLLSDSIARNIDVFGTIHESFNESDFITDSLYNYFSKFEDYNLKINQLASEYTEKQFDYDSSLRKNVLKHCVYYEDVMTEYHHYLKIFNETSVANRKKIFSYIFSKEDGPNKYIKNNSIQPSFYKDYAKDNSLDFVTNFNKEAWKFAFGEELVNELLNSLPKTNQEKRNAFTHNEYDRTSNFFHFLTFDSDSEFKLDSDHLKIATEYIKEFGLSQSIIVYNYFQTIFQFQQGIISKFPQELIQNQINSREDLIKAVKEIQKQCYSIQPMFDFSNFNEFQRSILSVATGHSVNRWTRTPIETLILNFTQDLTNGSIKPLPTEFHPDVTQVPLIKVEANNSITENKALSLLVNEINNSIDKKESIDDEKKIISDIIKQKILDLNNTENNQFVQNQITHFQERLSLIDKSDTIDSLLSSIIPLYKLAYHIEYSYDNTGNRIELSRRNLQEEVNSVLRQLVFKKAFHKHANSPLWINDLQSSLLNKEDISSAVSNIKNFLNNIIKDHTLNFENDNQEKYWDDSTYELMRKNSKNFKKNLSLITYINELDSFEKTFSVTQLDSGQNIKFVPDRGFIGEMSGYMADVCYTRVNHLLSQNPNLVPYKFIANPESENPEFIGSTLVFQIEDTDNQPVFLIRAFDIPKEQHYDIGKFFESFIDHLSSIAKSMGVKKIIAAGTSGTISNYTKTTNYVTSKYVTGKQNTPLKYTFNFNGYDITNQCYPVRNIS